MKQLFFMDKEVTEILCKNSEVLIMDCTYKTNKYRMPLLTICGVTSMGTTFIIGFAFLEKETKEYFDWVLYQVRVLYTSLGLAMPRIIATDRDLALMEAIDSRFSRSTTRHVLCLWHPHRNVAKNCKASFETDEEWQEFLAAWHTVIYANTHTKMEAAWRSLVEQYADDHEDDVSYLLETWLNPWQDRLCKCYTNEYMHFCITTTSRAEGIHRVLKTNLKFSTGDLMTVVDRIEVMLMNQRKKHREELGKAKRSTPHGFAHTMFQNLIGRVDPHAIWKIKNQFDRLQKTTEEEPLPSCTRVFAKTMGLPCSHIIKSRMEAIDGGLGRILIDDVHPHWRFKKPDSGLEPTEPFVSDLEAIDEALAEPLGVVKGVLNIDADPDQSLPSIADIMRDLKDNNFVQRPAPEAPNPAAELLDNGTNLLDVNDPRVVKAKGRPTGAKNRKGTMTRAKKAKAKSIRRDPSGFEHVDAAIQASRDKGKDVGRGRGGRGGRGEAALRSTVTARNKMSKRKQKELDSYSAANIDADILEFARVNAEIEADMQGIITREVARKTTEASAASASTAASAVTKEAIHVDTDDDFDADGDGDENSADDWMYDRGG